MTRQAKKAKAKKAQVKKPVRAPRKKAAAQSNKPSPGYRPRVVVKFRDDVSLPYDDRSDRALEENDRHWQRLKKQFPGISIRVLVKSETPARIRQLVEEARRQDDSYRPPNFLTYFVIDLPANVDSDELVKALKSWGLVETAYFDSPAEDPHIRIQNPPLYVEDPLMGTQGYLGPAGSGIDALFAWTQPGGDGAGPSFIDLEQGWTLEHADIKAHGAQLLHGSVIDSSRPHGTSVLGIVCAVRNHFGYRGIAHNVTEVNVISHSGNLDTIGDMICKATVKLKLGDVLLLEVERPGSRVGDAFPTEIFHSDFSYIKLATTKGITVVEAAGNGGLDLDLATDPDGIRVFANNARDSGAILVGAAKSLVHKRLGLSNFGSRVDCYAWGHNVAAPTSAMANDTTGTNPSFDGTSSAAAIIAGAALVVQGIAMARTGGRLNAVQLRSLLRNPTLSTPSHDPALDRIGVMPDLRKIISGNAIDRLLPVVNR